jgi:hypothetical protein
MLFPLLKKAERDEVPEPKTKGENKDSTYLKPSSSSSRSPTLQSPDLLHTYRRTQGCKRATEFYIKCIAARQFKCTYIFWKAGKMFNTKA